MLTCDLPRPEHPRPQFIREPWVNLNGTWTCELDLGRSGYDAATELSESDQARTSTGALRRADSTAAKQVRLV